MLDSGKFKSILEHMAEDIRRNFAGVLFCAIYMGISIACSGKFCPLRLLAGIPCPACGLTRAAALLLCGQIEASLRMNPFLLPLAAGGLLFFWEHYVLRKKAVIFSAYMVLCILLMILLYGFRMAEYFPFQEPMIYEPKNLLQMLRMLGHC